MGARHQIMLVAPSLLGPVPSTLADGVRDLGACQSLARFLSRAKHRRRAEPLTGESALMAQLQRCAVAKAADWPAAGAIAASALGLQDDRLYYRAAPVHLRADRDRVLLFAGQGLQLDEADAKELTHDFNALYVNDDIALSFSMDHWVLSATQAPGPDLPPLARVAGRYLDAVMPADEASRRWRQLLNEIQMFLHDHPVNQRRLKSGELAINGFWFWAGGEQRALPLSRRGRVIGDNALARGVAQLAELPCQSWQDLKAASGYDYTVIVWDQAEEALMSGDAQAWLLALSEFNDRFDQMLSFSMESPDCQVILDTGADVFTASAQSLRWRFWRRDQSLVNWIHRA